MFISLRITANVHICRGKVKSISIIGFSEQKNCCKTETMSNNCCQDLNFSLKQSHSQEEGNSTIVIKTPNFETLTFIVPVFISSYVNIALAGLDTFYYEPPPPEVFPKIYIKNCVYLI